MKIRVANIEQISEVFEIPPIAWKALAIFKFAGRAHTVVHESILY